jgi:hypothetical protein
MFCPPPHVTFKPARDVVGVCVWFREFGFLLVWMTTLLRMPLGSLSLFFTSILSMPSKNRYYTCGIQPLVWIGRPKNGVSAASGHERG